MDPAQLRIFEQRLRDSDPQARAIAMNQFVDAAFKENSLATKDDSNLLPLLATLLADPQLEVRRRAAECSAALAYSNSPKYSPGHSPATDLGGLAPLRGALLAALKDPDERVRDSALSAFALAFVLPPEVQDDLADRYESEKKLATFQTKIPYSLLVDNVPTPKATALLERLADDPRMCVHLAQMLRGFGKVPPAGLLPKFARWMREDADPNRRDAYFFAVVEYRQLAKPYLDDLEKVKEQEPNPIPRKRMAEAIQVVQNAR